MRWKPIFINLLHWFLETVLLALLPLVLYAILHWMFQLEMDPIRQYISELCSCTLAFAAANSVELAKDKYRRRGMRGLLMPLYIVLLLLFALLYGAVYFCMVSEYSLDVQVVRNIFSVMKLICFFHIGFSFLLQVIGGLLQC